MPTKPSACSQAQLSCHPSAYVHRTPRSHPPHLPPSADEEALRAKVEQMAAQFDATQYGFFGGTAPPEEEGLLLGELERDAAPGGGVDEGGEAPGRAR